MDRKATSFCETFSQKKYSTIYSHKMKELFQQKDINKVVDSKQEIFFN